MHQNYTDLTGMSHIVFDGTTQDISNSNFSYVTFHNSGTKTLSGTLDILNNLYISNSVTLDANNQYIYIEGNWQENGTGTFQQTGGRVTFDGTSANQTVTCSVSSYFYGFTIDKTGANKTVTANTDIDVNGTFDFAEDDASFDLNGRNLYVERDFYFRENCTFTHNNGKVFFDGISNAQLIRNYDVNEIVFDNAEFVGTAVKRLYDGSFRFEGDVFINNSTLEGQYWDHYVEGDWINTGVFRHDRTIHFDGGNQAISQSNFRSVRFGGGANTKTLGGDIFLNGNLYIDDATLDVSAANHTITLDDYFYNDSTGSFIAHEGTVVVTGEYNRVFTGETNTLYGAGQVVTQGGIKSFYNLEINATESNFWMFIHGNLTVLNDFTIVKGRFYQSYDPNNYGINDIEVGGCFINNGSMHNNNYGETFTLNPTAGSHTFKPGSSNFYGPFIFDGAAGTDYTFESNFSTYSNRTITINDGTLNLNTYDITTNNSGGDIDLNGGTFNANEGSILAMGSGATFTNAGGIFKIVGVDGNPASFIAASGNFNYQQTSGTSHFKYYRIENTNGNGMELSGGSLDATNSFQNGSFSEGTGTAYITLSGIDLGGDRTIGSVTLNSGPTYNVQRTSGNGVLTFENATGTLSGESYDNDDADPGTKIIWTYPGAARWTGFAGTTDWHTANNWSPIAVPTSASIVILDHSTVAGAYSVVISNSDADAKNVTINADATNISLSLNTKELTIAENITISANGTLTQTNATDTLKIGGSWANEGTFNENTAVVLFNPSSGTHTINTQGAGDSFYDFVIKGTGGTNVISSTLDINGDVKIEGGIINAGSQQITAAKDWSRTGGATFDAGTSTVTLDGTNQTINGGEFYNFITDNSGTKTLTANIDINNDITINAGTILDGGVNTIYVGDDWTNHVGNAGFTQSGMGTVIFDGTTSGQDIGAAATSPTTFNNVTICGTQTKYTRTDITINGNLIISSAGLYIVDGTTIDGAGVRC